MTVKKLTGRQIKWSLILSKYDFVINYITGKSKQTTRAEPIGRAEFYQNSAGCNRRKRG